MLQPFSATVTYRYPKGGGRSGTLGQSESFDELFGQVVETLASDECEATSTAYIEASGYTICKLTGEGATHIQAYTKYRILVVHDYKIDIVLPYTSHSFSDIFSAACREAVSKKRKAEGTYIIIVTDGVAVCHLYPLGVERLLTLQNQIV